MRQRHHLNIFSHQLILYESSQAGAESEIDAYEINLPYFTKPIDIDDAATIQNTMDNSLLMVKEGEIWKLEQGINGKG